MSSNILSYKVPLSTTMKKKKKKKLSEPKVSVKSFASAMKHCFLDKHPSQTILI